MHRVHTVVASGCHLMDASLPHPSYYLCKLPASSEQDKGLHIGRNNTKAANRMDNKELRAVSETVDLEFHMNQNLDFSKHCDVIAEAIGRLCNLFKPLSTSIPSILVQISCQDPRL